MSAMAYRSTRSSAARVPFSAAITQGLASDGGLFVPERWPAVDASAAPSAPLDAVASALLSPFLEGDALAPQLGAIAAEALNFPAPLTPLGADGRLGVLELFRGPTAAFKDFGARFLASCLTRLRAHAPRRLRILVATSGDTGGAVAAAFHDKPGIDVAVLYPKGLVSPLQERQLTCWGGNVRAFAVRGVFDDCQRLVKAAFQDKAITAASDLSSANSINLGRLLPQMTYFAAASLRVWRAHGEPASFVVPSGNLGHATACVWARRVGMPIDRIVLAHNANRTMPDFLASGDWAPRPSIATPASAMDVGEPSNAERLRDMFPDVAALRRAVSAVSIESEAIAPRICAGHAEFGQVWCPHTAVAAEAYARLPAEERARRRWVLAATAHPAKFREIVEPAIGANVALPPSLAALLQRPSASTEIDPDLGALRAALG
jgi:threonine synthase